MTDDAYDGFWSADDLAEIDARELFDSLLLRAWDAENEEAR